MTAENTFYEISISPRFVMTKGEVLTALGGNEDLFRSLCDHYGLRPVDRKHTRKTYRTDAVQAALREKELAENLEN